MCGDVLLPGGRCCSSFIAFGERLFFLFFSDDDGDLIAITSDEELLIALTEMSGQEIRKLYVSILPNSVDETQFPRGPANVVNGTQHANVVCDHCAGPVQGYRYKCIQCPDFDLCANCEMRGAHSDHFMIRLSNPLPLVSHFFYLISTVLRWSSLI